MFKTKHQDDYAQFIHRFLRIVYKNFRKCPAKLRKKLVFLKKTAEQLVQCLFDNVAKEIGWKDMNHRNRQSETNSEIILL